MRFKQEGLLENYIQFEYVLVRKKKKGVLYTSDLKDVNREIGLITQEGHKFYGKYVVIEPYAVRSIKHDCLDKEVWLTPHNGIVGVVTLDDDEEAISMQDYFDEQEKIKREAALSGTNKLNLYTPKLSF